jgi:hypothetical protein
MKHAKHTILVLCLFVLYCVLLSQGLKASAASTFLGALAAVPLTIHVYHRVWPVPSGRRRTCQPTVSDEADRPEAECVSSRTGA